MFSWFIRKYSLGHVRFTPESGHVRCNERCPLWARSGHSDISAKYRSELAALVLAFREVAATVNQLNGTVRRNVTLHFT